MRLVKLEIKGFKSFAHQTVLHFREDVIGVVGPNGSGKSNIVDAIRWVLGEQKTGELRLDKMSSVIFNGTHKRKPGNVAQVFLTFDNDRGVLRSDFHEVTIGRLLYRNGDSEYRLNGVVCRRKDITDLFVDTGIESNSYSIIALGMVDDILADKDNSRLRMLEQAAGISVYKVRKKETLSRLERTQEDLDRVDDLVHEIDGQLAALEKQARRTKKYFVWRDDYRSASLDFAYLSSRSLERQRRGVEGELARAEAFVTTTAAELSETDTNLQGHREEHLTEEHHLGEERRRLGLVQAKLRGAISDKQLAEQKLAYLSQNLDKLRQQRARAIGDQERLSAEFARRTLQVAQAEDGVTAFAKTLDEARIVHLAQQERVATLRGTVRENTERLQQAERTLLETDKRLAVVESRIDALDQERSARAHRRERAEQQQAELIEDDLRSARQLALFRKRLATSEREDAERATEQGRLRDELDQLAPRLSQLASERQRVGNEADMLRAAFERLEGSSESDKYLANKLGWRERYPQFGELLEVPDAYRPAVEAAFADVLGAFVVPDAGIAAEGLQVLAEANQPQTTVLFIDLSGHNLPSHDLDRRGAPIGAEPLLRHVEVPEAYREILRELGAGLYVTPAHGSAPVLGAGQQLVDAAGTQLWSRASARGGAVNRQLGRQTGRRQRLEAQRQLLEQLTIEHQQVELLRARTALALQQLKAEVDQHALTTLRREVARAERDAATATARLESALLQRVDQDKVEADARSRAEALSSDQAALELRRGPQAQALELAERNLRAFDDDNQSAAAALADASAAFNTANLRVIQLQNHVQSLARERDFIAQQLEEVERALFESREALDADGSAVETVEAKVLEVIERIRNDEETRAAHQALLQTREEAFYARRMIIADLEKRQRQTQQELTDGQGLTSRLRERRTEVDYRLNSLAERLRIEFNLDLASAISAPRNVEGSLAELEASLLKQKQRLDSFGEINPLAVEAYDAMYERREGIASQKEDIESAMTDLRQTVAEIDQTATVQLLAAFEAVRGHFTEVFRHLFDAEDTADMVMLNPEAPLNSKIEIIAKPKGKRPQTINQLSGGEKTLTATAFLFALYLIKPAPFCIFDEVDAPLDDANVEKFNRIIKRFSKGSQFIIVTHNKLTMAAVDTIYGVYMPELGVSHVAPVDFRQFEHSELLELVG